MKRDLRVAVMALDLCTVSILAACGTATMTTNHASSAARTSAPAISTSAATGTVGPVSTPAPASTPARRTAPAHCHSGTCWVDVSVATAWVKPWYPRAIDAPGLSNPAFPDTWLSKLSVAQRAWLVGKVETQAVYGTQVTVTDHWGAWSHVTIGDQPTNRDGRGYPGWVPTAQLTGTAPATARQYAVVRSPTAWIWSAWSASGVSGHTIMLSSYDTSFPVVSATAHYVEVQAIGGSAGALRPTDWRPGVLPRQSRRAD